ncbi:phosphate acetyltransferase [Fodinibius halophilus]|uniref:Phosphate acetyltransferase n=1 Tax=Fodinibius halophilus TaxID=1736908 RepID=A0A6M1TKV1_9BACT|nr:phosphate acetyltransferase [Fodinibius halophilus]NGP89100.1 phosphate acetyltransferase [Fodinibius halophilus]
MASIIDRIRGRAASKNKKIVLPETGDHRVLRAGAYLARENICEVILVGRKKEITARAESEGIALADRLSFYPPDEINETLVTHLYNRRKHKGISREEATSALENPLYLGGSLVAQGDADGCVAGSVATTGEVIRAAIHTIGLRQGTGIVSSTFLMALQNGRVLTYADCGVVPYPDKEQLAVIAVESARTHELLTEDEPVVAMLSFSTKGSARHERTELVTDALTIAKQKDPDLAIDGELQFDAAFVPSVAKRKAPRSEVAGKANVFIFPNLDAGNIAYKITERLAGAGATGPILQGLARPMMDLSRGCSWQDIVNAACVAILMDSS